MIWTAPISQDVTPLLETILIARLVYQKLLRQRLNFPHFLIEAKWQVKEPKSQSLVEPTLIRTDKGAPEGDRGRRLHIIITAGTLKQVRDTAVVDPEGSWWLLFAPPPSLRPVLALSCD